MWQDDYHVDWADLQILRPLTIDSRNQRLPFGKLT